MKIQTNQNSTTFTTVDVAAPSCSCNQPRCIHLEIASDLINNGGRRWRWLVLSAFHKELRRGDVAKASHWAAWFARCDGPAAPLEYMRKIWCEETADLQLAVWLHSDAATVDSAVTRFCAATKFWELPELWAAFQEYAELRADPTRRVPGTWASDFAAAEAGEDAAALAILRTRALADLAADGRLSAAEVAVFQRRYASGRFENEDFMLVILLTSRLPRDAMSEIPQPAPELAAEWTDGSMLLLPPDYAYDYHLFFGKARMGAWLAAHPGSGFRFGVDTSPIDLRWAGGLVPLFWRVQAWQFGGTAAMHRLTWHELPIEPAVLQRFSAWCDGWPEDALR